METLAILQMAQSIQKMELPSVSLQATSVILDLALKEIDQDNVVNMEHGQETHHPAKSKVNLISWIMHLCLSFTIGQPI